MKYCKKCGIQIEDDSKFCYSCGEPQAAKEVFAADETDSNQDNASIHTQAAIETIKESYAQKLKKCFSVALAFIKKHLKIFAISIGALVVVIIALTVYDATHCDYSGCKNSSVSGSDFCYSHMCNLCKDRKAYNSDYCYYHKALYDSSTSSSTSSATRDLKFSNINIQHNSLYTVVTGSVTNNGSRSYKFVSIKGAFKNSSGTVVDTDTTYAVGSEGLSPGESTTFRMSIDKNYNVKKCDISIVSYK